MYACFLLLQHGADYTEEVPPLTLTGSKAAAMLAVSERWLQQLEKLYRAEASSSSEAHTDSGLGCHLASGDAVLKWLSDWKPVVPCTHTLPGKVLRTKISFRLPESTHVESQLVTLTLHTLTPLSPSPSPKNPQPPKAS